MSPRLHALMMPSSDTLISSFNLGAGLGGGPFSNNPSIRAPNDELAVLVVGVVVVLLVLVGAVARSEARSSASMRTKSSSSRASAC
jgi:hypothetical protein